MTHWGWYWKVKKQHSPKALCSWQKFAEIDSFQMFKNKQLIQLIKASKDRISLIMSQYHLIATLQDDNSLSVQFIDGAYIIPVEQKPCNFGGFYYFFHCPGCSKRMRKLYCFKGKYLCRKCAKLGYYTQRLRPSERNLYRTLRIKEKLTNRGGSLENKPPRMQTRTFNKYKSLYIKYDKKWLNENYKELCSWYGPKVNNLLDFD